MAAILSLIGGVKGLFIIALVLALGTYIGVLHHKATVAETAQKVAEANAAQANADRDKAIKVAQDNAATIAALNQEKQNINDALNTLQSAKNQNASNNQTRQVIITQGASVPANQAIAAPIIGTMIHTVQADRFGRRGIPDTQDDAASASKGIVRE